MYTVLIVEDEIALCKGLGILIPWEDFGFQVVDYAFDGKEALAKIRRRQYDLILSDIKMPNMDGLELIKAVRDLKYDTKVVIISAYRDFEYAKKAMKYGVRDFITKPVDESTLINLVKEIKSEISEEEHKIQAFDKSKRIMREKLLQNVVSGSEEYDGMVRQLSQYGIAMETSLMYVCLIKVEASLDASRREELMAGIDGVVRKYCEGYSFSDSEGRICIILCFNNTTYENKAGLESELFETVNAGFPARVTIAVGHRAKDIAGLRSSYGKAGEILGWALFNEKRCLLDDQNLNWQEDIDKKAPLWSFERLNYLIRAGDTAKIRSELNNIFQGLESGRHPVEAVCSILDNYIMRLEEWVKETGGNASEIIGEDYYLKKLDRLPLNKLKEVLVESFIKASNFINITQKHGGNRTVTGMLEYIEKYYHEDLNLKRLSAEFHMNPVYLGKLFYSITGSYFNDYLNDCRINNAARLLKSSDLKVYEVAERVGYLDINYFYRMFKERKGMSPYKYRKNSTNL